MQSAAKNFWTARGGNIAIMGALFAPIVVIGTALAVDYSSLMKQRRSEQTSVDLAAIAGAQDPTNAEALVLRYFADNGIRSAVKSGDAYILPDGKQTSPAEFDAVQMDCVAKVEAGRYAPDGSVSHQARFVPDTMNPNAVKVTQTCKGQLHFGASIMSPPDITVSGTSASSSMASFWIGSRLASLNGGILNAVLGGLTGSTLSLDVMDYRALVNANVDLLPTMKLLAVSLDMQAATYDQLLQAKIGFGQFFKAVRTGGNLSASAQAGLRSLEASLAKNDRTFQLAQILNLDALKSQQIGHGYNGNAKVSAYDLVRAAAVASNGVSQVAVDVDLNVPGLAGVKLRIAIGEPPASARSVTINTPSALIRTAQTRLSLTVKTGGLLWLAGIDVTVPLYLELASGEAQLTNISCRASRPDQVELAVVPAVAGLAIGNVDPSAFVNFGSTPRVTSATLVQALAVKIIGSSQVDVRNTYKTALAFSGSDIDFARVKTVSVNTAVSSLTSSLVDHLDVTVNLSSINLNVAGALYKRALQATLSALETPLDGLVNSVLAALGVKVGQVDVGVTGASCGSPVLVL